jgi:hypothetical protein
MTNRPVLHITSTMRLIVRLRRGELRCLDRRSSRATTRRRADRPPPVRQPASPFGWRTPLADGHPSPGQFPPLGMLWLRLVSGRPRDGGAARPNGRCGQTSGPTNASARRSATVPGDQERRHQQDLRPAATRAVHRPGEGGPGRGGRPHELAPGRHLSGLRGQHLVGIRTERDLTAAVGQGADPATTRCRTRLPGSGGPGPDSELAEGQMGWPRGGFYPARWVDRLLFGQTGPAPPSWFPTNNGRWR